MHEDSPAQRDTVLRSRGPDAAQSRSQAMHALERTRRPPKGKAGGPAGTTPPAGGAMAGEAMAGRSDSISLSVSAAPQAQAHLHAEPSPQGDVISGG